jgi:hypothetical protein
MKIKQLHGLGRGIKHRKRAAYLWGRVDRPIKEKKLTIQYGQNIYRQPANLLYLNHGIGNRSRKGMTLIPCPLLTQGES